MPKKEVVPLKCAKTDRTTTEDIVRRSPRALSVCENTYKLDLGTKEVNKYIIFIMIICKSLPFKTYFFFIDKINAKNRSGPFEICGNRRTCNIYRRCQIQFGYVVPYVNTS